MSGALCERCGGTIPQRSLGGQCPRCLLELATDAPSAERPEVELPNYRIVRQLGEGGMGEVFEAEQLAPLRRRVALKVIKWGMSTRDVLTRFESEQQALALMSHPAIAGVYEAGATDDGNPYFAMELVEGEPINDYCDRRQLSNVERLELFVQICEGVQHAHQKGIIHRDLKPSNVLVATEGGRATPKIIDFGIAKATSQRLTERTLFTERGLLIGTPEYMSPEQADLAEADIDTRTDLYSLGVMLYELLTGALPFEPSEVRRAGFFEIQRRILEDEPERPSTRISRLGGRSAEVARSRGTDPRTLRRSLKGDLDWIVMKCLEKSRDRRYESASSLGRDIARHLSDQPVLAGPPSLAYRAAKFLRRHRLAASAAGLVMMALVVGLSLATIGLLRAQRAEAEASTARDRTEAINQFLLDSLSAAGPYRGVGREVTVVEMLDGAVERMETSFGERPELRAAVGQTIAETYHELGRLSEAEALLRPLLEDGEARLGPDHPQVLDLAGSLGVVLANQGGYSEAESLARRVYESRRGDPDAEPESIAEAAGNLGLVLVDLARLGEAEELLREAVRLRRLSEVPDPAALGTALNNLAMVLGRRGSFTDAETIHREALELRRTAHPSPHPQIAESLANLAGILRKTGSEAEAEEHYREAIGIFESTLGTDHPRMAFLYNNLAGLLRASKPEEAKELYREAVRLTEAHLGADSPRLASALSNLAMLESHLGNHEEALALHNRALEIRREALGEDHPLYALSIEGIAAVYHQSDRLPAAERQYRRALGLYLESFDTDHWRVGHLESSLGDCLRRLGHYEEAEELLVRAGAKLEKSLGGRDRLTRRALDRLAELYDELGRSEKAAAVRARIMQPGDPGPIDRSPVG